jgi:hypothetical protein
MAANSTLPRLSIGAMWLPINFLPSISTGLTYDQSGHLRWAMGLGYSNSFMEAHVATLDILSTLSPNYFKPQASFAVDLAWKIIN